MSSTPAPRQPAAEYTVGVPHAAPASPLQPTGGPWLSITEAAAYSRVSPDTIRRAIRNRQLRASRPARLWRILRADLDAFMEGGVR